MRPRENDSGPAARSADGRHGAGIHQQILVGGGAERMAHGGQTGNKLRHREFELADEHAAGGGHGESRRDPAPAANASARLATSRLLPTLGSPPTNRMPCGGSSPGSIQPGGGAAGCSASNWASESTAAGVLGGALFHSRASEVASSKMASFTACSLRAAANRRAVNASLLTLRRMPLVA